MDRIETTWVKNNESYWAKNQEAQWLQTDNTCWLSSQTTWIEAPKSSESNKFYSSVEFYPANS